MIPTISSVTPASVPSMGGTPIIVLGTGFRLPTPPPPSGIVPVPPKSVRVLFGVIPPKDVLVLSPTRLLVISPAMSLFGANDVSVDSVISDITVENIDDLGVTIPTETITLNNIVTFFRPDLSSENMSTLTALTREIIRGITSSVVKNVVLTQSSDYGDGDSTPYTVVAETPGISLSGPSLIRSSNPDGNVDTTCPINATESYVIQSPKIVHVLFEVIGYANNPADEINLLQLFNVWVERTGRISVPLNPLNLAEGYSVHEIEIDSGSDGTSGREYGPAMNSNLHYFSLVLRVRDFILGGIPGVAFDAAKGYTAKVDEVLPSAVGFPEVVFDRLQPQTP
jgi:hypothetical protein